MFLRLTCVYFIFCIFIQVNATPTFGLRSESGGSLLGDVLRTKAEIFDDLKRTIHQTLHAGTSVVANNVHNLGSSLSTSLDATGRLIDDGIAAGKEYGKTIFHSAIIVPKTILELATACFHHTGYIEAGAAQKLTYVDGRPEHLFQYITEAGQIMPITAEVAHELVPGLSV